MTHDHAERRARRLLRWYPPSWRARYGEEFLALLECELADRPRSLARSANVAWSGLVARSTATGIAGLAGDATVQARRSLAWVTGSLAVFLAFALTLWSQLTVGWQWQPPRSTGTEVGMVTMSLGVLALAVLGAVAVARVLAAVARRVLERRARGLVVPVLVAVLGAVALVVGARRFENGWPGTGGHPWSSQGLVPGGVGAFTWAATLSVTSYWVHPGALGSFPASELAWMAASPLALVALGWGGAVTIRRVELPVRAQRLELRLAQCAAGAMAVVLFGALTWLTDQSQPVVFHTGAIDVLGAVVMAGALGCAAKATSRGLAATGRVAS